MALGMSPERMSEEAVRLGRTLVTRLFVLLKTSQNYSEGHGAVDAAVTGVLKMVREIQRRNEDATLRFKGRYFYLGDMRLKPDATGFQNFGFVREELTRRGVGGLCFGRSASVEDLRGFVYSLQESEPQPGQPAAESYPRVLERMRLRQVAGIDLELLPPEAAGIDYEQFQVEELRDARLKARRLYQQAADAMDRVLANAAAGKPLQLRESKRLVQQVIDLLPGGESSLIGLATLRRPRPRSRNHAGNVCILSLALGRRLGMSKSTLCELGMAALFHDIGTVGMPREIIELPVGLSSQDQLALEAHPLIGVSKIMQLKALDTLSARIVTGVFEHHLLADLSGYPRVPYRTLSLFGRIISIADGYDALCASWESGNDPCPPERAVLYLFTQAGKAYDRALLKLFIAVVGLHPIGSLLQLDSKELAVVVGNSPDPAQWTLPRVKIISDAGGREADGGGVDLARARGSRSIAGVLDPNRYRLDLSRYLP
jgi:HD-GYP domain-containing protein (c-di-GMP phosphodiesterase class II)